MRTLALVMLFAACERTAPEAPEPRAPAIAVPKRDVLDKRFVDTVRKATEMYRFWGTVDDEMRGALPPCSAGAMGFDSSRNRARMSGAGDGPHVAKLFYLYASDRDVYIGDKAVPVGFTIVKESYEPVKLSAEEVARRSENRVQAGRGWGPDPSTVFIDGAHYEMGEMSALFAMQKVGDETMAGTDRGWIYAIMDTEHDVKAVGRIERCAKCHEDATHERLFGVEVVPSPKGMNFGE